MTVVSAYSDDPRAYVTWTGELNCLSAQQINLKTENNPNLTASQGRPGQPGTCSTHPVTRIPQEAHAFMLSFLFRPHSTPERLEGKDSSGDEVAAVRTGSRVDKPERTPVPHRVMFSQV